MGTGDLGFYNCETKNGCLSYGKVKISLRSIPYLEFAGGLPCKLEGIIESPLVNGYRNKCEFSVGYSLQGKPTVGFLLGNFRSYGLLNMLIQYFH